MEQPRDGHGRWRREDKTKRVYARCTPQQFDLIVRRAKERDETLSAYLLGAVDRDVMHDPRTAEIIEAARRLGA